MGPKRYITGFVGIVFALLLLSEIAEAQNISLEKKDVPISSVLTEIQKLCGYSVVVRSDELNVSSKVCVLARNKDVTALIKEVFAMSGQIVDVSIQGKHIIVFKASLRDEKKSASPVYYQGRVTDENDNPLPGVFVRQKGSENATLTDENGEYLLSVPAGEEIEFVSLGYVTQSRPAGLRESMDIRLSEDVIPLSEVVAIGYGTLEKKMVTNSVSSVLGKSLLPGTGSISVASALRGKVSNLVVYSSDSPNAEPAMQLRGLASINAQSRPLIVIDGMTGGDLSSLVVEDIQSIDVLKDAAAGAIYGTRAAGGVILVTTNNASDLEPGAARLSYTSELSRKSNIRNLDIIDREFYLDVYGKYYNAIDYGGDTDWYNTFLNKENLSHKQNLNFQANTKVAKVYSNIQYSSNEGLSRFDSRKDISGRINANVKLLGGWIDLMPRLEYRQSRKNDNALDFATVFINPTRPIYDSTQPDGYSFDMTSDFNVIRERQYNTSDELKKWFQPQISVKLNVLPVEGLFFKQDAAYEFSGSETMSYVSSNAWTQRMRSINGSAGISRGVYETLNVEGYGDYSLRFGNNSLKVVGGYSFNRKDGYEYSMANYDFSNDGVKYWNIGEGSYLNSGRASMDSHRDAAVKLLAFFGRINYDCKGKYILMASIRREGSSVLAAQSRWGNFWSVSGGWRISEEPWLQGHSFIDDLKLRASYGVTGNCGFDSCSVAMYKSGEYPIQMPNRKWAWAYQYDGDVNPDLKWEEQHGLNFGVDFSFWNGKLYGKLDLYQRNVNDMIYNAQVPMPPYHSGLLTKNIGSMVNYGYEFELGSEFSFPSGLSYNHNIRFSHESSKLVELDGTNTYFELAELNGLGSGGTGFLRLEEGRRLGGFYILECAGVDKETGDFLIKNRDGRIIQGKEASDGDRKQIGNYVPFVTVSWDHRLSWRGWELGLDLRSWIDFDVFNSTEFYHGLPASAGLKRAFTKNADLVNARLYPSSYFLEDGTFLKIDALSVSRIISIKGFPGTIKAYLSAENLATITAYHGMDPEICTIGLDGGFEYIEYQSGDNSLSATTVYPRSRNIILGIQIFF